MPSDAAADAAARTRSMKRSFHLCNRSSSATVLSQMKRELDRVLDQMTSYYKLGNMVIADRLIRFSEIPAISVHVSYTPVPPNIDRLH